MLYATNLSRMLDEVFAFPYQAKVLEDSFVYDSVKAEKDGSSIISVVVPGYSKEDLVLSARANTLCLKSKSDSGKKLTRYWKLGDSVDLNNISAECKNGILNIKVPLKQKEDNLFTINIL